MFLWKSLTIASPSEESVLSDPPPSRSHVVDHPGLVAGLCDARGMGDVLHRATPPDPHRRDLPVGAAGTALGRNGLGCINPARALVPRGCHNTPPARRMSPRVAPQQLPADALRRAVETLAPDGVPDRSRLSAATAAPRLGRAPPGAPLETPSGHGDGRDNSDQAPDAPRLARPCWATRASQCSDLAALEGHGTDLLATRSPQGVGKRGRRVAVDGVALPSHGTVEEAHHGEVCRSTAQGGTTHFLPSATASAVVQGRRSPLARCRVRATQPMDSGLRTLRTRLGTLGLRIPRRWLDRGGYSVRVIPDRSPGALPCSMPAVTRGKKPPPPGGPTGTSALAETPQGHWPPYTVQRAQEGHVAFDLAVVCHNPRGHRGRHQRAALLYATWGLTPRAVRWSRATYRRRCGMAASSRQSQQARRRTSSRKPAWRLLGMGVALVWRHVGGWLHAAVIAQPHRGAPQLRPQSLRFARLRWWLIMEGARHARLLRKIPVYHDFYERAHAFGIVFNY